MSTSNMTGLALPFARCKGGVESKTWISRSCKGEGRVQCRLAGVGMVRPCSRRTYRYANRLSVSCSLFRSVQLSFLPFTIFTTRPAGLACISLLQSPISLVVLLLLVLLHLRRVALHAFWPPVSRRIYRKHPSSLSSCSGQVKMDAFEVGIRALT